MGLVNRILSALGETTVTQLRIHFDSINNAHCNGDPTRKEENEFLVYSNSTTCEWDTRDGATIPLTDDPLIEGRSTIPSSPSSTERSARSWTQPCPSTP